MSTDEKILDAKGWPIIVGAAVRYEPPAGFKAVRGRVVAIEDDGTVVKLMTERGFRFAKAADCTVLAGADAAKWSKRLEILRAPAPTRRR